MSIESDLRKDGIEVVKKLDTLTINSLARNISSKLCNAFSGMGLNERNLFIELSRLDMYVAKMPEGMSEATYFYKNSAIYFNEHIPDEDREEFAVHECIHHIQEVKDKKNYLIRMGLCDYTEFKIYGLALNEAAVQLMASKVNNIPLDSVKYYGIEFDTISPSYYPVECNLVSQLAYLVGEDVLFSSTLNSTDDFKNKVAELTSLKTYYEISNSLDKILEAEQTIIKLNNKILEIDDRNKKVDMMVRKISNLKNSIRSTFISTQNLIISSFFDSSFNNVSTLEDVENYRKSLYKFRDYIGVTDNYSFFNDYYIEKMNQLEHRYNVIENGGIETALDIQSKQQNLFVTLWKALRKLVGSAFGAKDNVS